MALLAKLLYGGAGDGFGRSLIERRHHLHEERLQRAIKLGSAASWSDVGSSPCHGRARRRAAASRRQVAVVSQPMQASVMETP